ncbi:MAG: DNRLRE domain-containing protein [Chloroflexi bacterium]|nr:DNRLRE domain-containing protein [Chloroflexota bacterium]
MRDDDGGEGCDEAQAVVAAVLRFRGQVYEGPRGDHSQPLPGVELTLYGRNEGDPEPGTVIGSETSVAGGFFNFHLIAPWLGYESYTLAAATPGGMVPVAVWSEGGMVASMTSIRWANPAREVYESAFYFESPTPPPSAAITETVELPLLNDGWVTWGHPDGNYDGWAGLSVWTTGLDNALLKFDRSLLPQNAVIISATLRVDALGQTGAEGKELVAMNVSPYTPLQVTYATAPEAYNPSRSVLVPLAAGPLLLDVASQVRAWER